MNAADKIADHLERLGRPKPPPDAEPARLQLALLRLLRLSRAQAAAAKQDVTPEVASLLTRLPEIHAEALAALTET